MASSVIALVAITMTLAVGPAAMATTAHQPIAVAATSCGVGYTHAVIGGEQKCLRRGEFCAHRYNAQYHRYGYSCTRRDSRGDYHLS